MELLAQTDSIEDGYAALSGSDALRLHYLLWAKKGSEVGVDTTFESLRKWFGNDTCRRDLLEIIAWRRSQHAFPTSAITLPFPCSLQLHAADGSAEIKAALGLATLQKTGPTGVGLLHLESLRCYIHLVTFLKSEQDFSPTTQYRDYPISRRRLPWESQSGTTQKSTTGQNHLHFRERGYTILIFARLEKRIEGETMPFLFLGPAKQLISAEGDRPIAMMWELEHPMPAVLFEEARAA